MSNLLTDSSAWAVPLPDGWEYHLLSDLISFYVDNRGRSAPTAETGIRLIATNCIKNENLYPVYEKVRYVTRDVYDSWFRAHPEPNDIIIVNKGTPGLTNLVPDPADFVIAQDMMAIRANTDIVFPLYLFAALRSPHFLAQVNAITVGTTIPHLKKTDFDKLIIPVPPFDEQNSIGELYFCFSQKIEANRRMNATLEATARALFKSWFVDFDPVRAKARGEQPAGMDVATAALFPDHFEDSELGPIPAGWGVGRVGDIATMERNTINPLNHAEELFWHYSLPAYDEGRMPKLEYGQEIKSNKYLLPDGCVLLSKLNPQNMKVWIPMPYDDYAAIASTEFLVMIPQNGFTCEYLYTLFSTDDFARVFSNLVTGTSSSHQRVKPDYLLGMDALVPPQLIVRLFTAIVEAFYQQVLANQDESRTLAETRDALLPRLVSGELRVGENE